MVEYETPLQPPVLGGAELRRFTGDRGGNCTEIVLGGQCLLDNEEHVPEWAMVALTVEAHNAPSKRAAQEMLNGLLLHEVGRGS